MAETLNLPFPSFDESHSRDGSGESATADPALNEVHAWFLAQPKMGERFAKVFRQSIDEVLDGQRTGRFDVHGPNVAKTERTYLGTKVEIVCQAEFALERGARMDYSVSGHEVDAKFSMSSQYGQSIPREAVGHICLFMYADDRKGLFSVGLLEVTDDILNRGANQDGKRTINQRGRSRMRWLIRDGRLPENQLLRLPEDRRKAIFARGLSGQERVNELFRQVQGRIVHRRTVVTVAQQHDGPKRVRDARPPLASAGIMILGYRDGHPVIARDLELPAPRQGEWVSVRVVPQPPGDERPAAVVQGVRYVVARDDEQPCELSSRYGVGE